MSVTCSSPIACEPTTTSLVSCADAAAAGRKSTDVTDAMRVLGVITEGLREQIYTSRATAGRGKSSNLPPRITTATTERRQESGDRETAGGRLGHRDHGIARTSSTRRKRRALREDVEI